MSCYFHQNLAFIAFRTKEQMLDACQLRLYTEDDRLITGQPRLEQRLPSIPTSVTSKENTYHKAMTFQSTAYSDVHVTQQPKQRHSKARKTHNQTSQDHTTQMQLDSINDNPTLDPQQTGHLQMDQMCLSTVVTPPPQEAYSSRFHFPIDSHSSQLHSSSQLDLILAKLSELDAIKQHITNLNTRLNLLQPLPSNPRCVAQRS